jgi:hypothetical protein
LVGVFKGTIADQFAIDPSIGGAIDVFEENAPQIRRNLVTGLVYLNLNSCGADQCSSAKRRQGESQQNKVSHMMTGF